MCRCPRNIIWLASRRPSRSRLGARPAARRLGNASSLSTASRLRRPRSPWGSATLGHDLADSLYAELSCDCPDDDAPCRCCPFLPLLTAAQSFEQVIESAAPVEAPGAILSGTVADSTGAVIPGASISIRDSRLSVAKTGRADALGRYLFANLAPGTYQIEADAPGFEKLSLAEDIAASQHAVANLTLSVGQTSQTVSVSAASSQLEFQQTTAASAKAKKGAASPAKSGAAPPPAKQSPPIFVVVTDVGDRWTSADGLSWQRESGGHK